MNRSNWIVSINAIINNSEFWEIVSKNAGKISEIELAFVTPNIWNGKTATDDALKALRSKNNAQEVEVKLINHDKNLKPDSEEVRSAVEYISKGGGRTRIKRGNKILYNSENKAISETPDEDIAIQDADLQLIYALFRRLFRK
jgi:hypothetical protein